MSQERGEDRTTSFPGIKGKSPGTRLEERRTVTNMAKNTNNIPKILQ